MTENLLTLEQQFSLNRYKKEIKGASREELETLFVEVLRQKMAQENLFKKLIKL